MVQWKSLAFNIFAFRQCVCIEWDSVMCMCDVVSCGVVHVISSPMQCAFLLVYIYDFEHTLTKKSSVNII